MARICYANLERYDAWLPGSGKFNGTAWQGAANNAYISDYMSGRHNDGINMAFADGHVKFLKSEAVWDASLLANKNPFRPSSW